MSLTSAVEKSNDLSWCPSATCGYAFVKVCNEHKCKKCEKSYCLDCRVEMHEFVTCIEFKAQRVNNLDDSDVISLLTNVIKAKQCPNCKFWVEKN